MCSSDLFGVGGAGLHVPCNESERIKWHLVCLSLGLMSRATRNDQAALAWAHRLPLAAGAKAAGQGCWAGPAVGIGVAPRAEGRALVMPCGSMAGLRVAATRHAGAAQRPSLR